MIAKIRNRLLRAGRLQVAEWVKYWCVFQGCTDICWCLGCGKEWVGHQLRKHRGENGCVDSCPKCGFKWEQ